MSKNSANPDPGNHDADANATFALFSRWIAELAAELNTRRNGWVPQTKHRGPDGTLYDVDPDGIETATVKVFDTSGHNVKMYAKAQAEMNKLLNGTIEQGLHITNVDVEFVHAAPDDGNAGGLTNSTRGERIVGVVVKGLIGPSANFDPGDYSSRSSSSKVPP